MQYLDMKDAGTLISVEDALNTPGALLFKFPSEPQPGQARQHGSHVAISLGDGRTMEAMGTNYGVRIAEAGDRFGYAALIPGMNYAAPPPTINDDPNADPLPPPPPAGAADRRGAGGPEPQRDRHRPRHAAGPLRAPVHPRPGRSPTRTATASPTATS